MCLYNIEHVTPRSLMSVLATKKNFSHLISPVWFVAWSMNIGFEHTFTRKATRGTQHCLLYLAMKPS